jgi:hypothetical protein
LTNPDAPVSLANNAVVTKGNQIGLTWIEGLANGGSVVIDYRVSLAEESAAYSVIASGVVGLSYTATDLSPGTRYKIKI